MGKLSRVLRWVDTFSKWQGYVFCFLFLTLIGQVIFDIMARELAIKGVAWGWDVEWFHLAALMTLLMAFAAYHNAHVRIDLITASYPPRVQSLLTIFTNAVLVIPYSIIVITAAWGWVMQSFVTSEVSETVLWMLIWPIKSLLIIGLGCLIPQSLVDIIREIVWQFKGVRP